VGRGRFPGFIGPSYTLQSVNVDAQRCVNLYPEINQLGTGKEREVAALNPTPGLTLRVTLATAPVRGIHRASTGALFAVGGNVLYEINTTLWTATSLGTLKTSLGAVSIADNGDDVLVVDGSFGYGYTISTTTFAEITDNDFYGADTVTFLDSYFILNRSGTTQFFISGSNALTFAALDIEGATSSADNVVGVIAYNENLYVFGEQSLEGFYNSGSTFTFTRYQGSISDVGCSAAHSIAKGAGEMFWLGGDSTGSGIIYKMQGFKPVRISTSSIEREIRLLTQTQIASARGYVYQQSGHIFYCLSIPGLTSTWVYDVVTGLWHERVYQSNGIEQRHRADCHSIAGGLSVVGDWQNGKVYTLDEGVYSDDSNEILRLRTAPHLSKNSLNVFHRTFILDMETGVGLDGSGQGTDPVVIMDFSDDGGHSWSNERQGNIGKIGVHRSRVKWNRLGMSKDRVYRVKVTDPVKVVLIGADINIESGTS